VLDPHQERLDLAKRFGAEGTIRAERGGVDVERLKRTLPGGRAADQVFEAVGRPEARELAIEMAQPGGVVNLFGGCPRDSRVRRLPNPQVRLLGFLPGLTTPGGVTHQAIDDVALMRALPNMTVLDTGDATEVETVLDVVDAVPGPVYCRVLRGEVPRLFADPMRLSK